MDNLNLRPKTLNEFLGKEQIKENLNVFINAAKQRNTTLDHVLLYGLPGTGKTTIATIIANEFNKKLKIIQGTQLKKINDLMNCISLITEGDFIFIDEIHAVSIECLETLYTILEDYCIDIKIGPENNQKITRVSLPKFTLIGATTNINKIPKPLEERFPIYFFFDLYQEQEIYEIINRSNKILNLSLTEEEKCIITQNCKGIPRIANNLLKRIVDFKTTDKHLSINEILKKLGIYACGLQEIDLKYLTLLKDQDEAISLKTISAIIQLDQPTIEEKIEPFLIKNQLIKKSSRGRCITKKGCSLLNEINYEHNITN